LLTKKEIGSHDDQTLDVAYWILLYAQFIIKCRRQLSCRLVYHRFGFFKIKVTVRICHRFGLFNTDVAIMVCRRFSLSPFRFVSVSTVADSVRLK